MCNYHVRTRWFSLVVTSSWVSTKQWVTICVRGVVTALKPVWVQQVRQLTPSYPEKNRPSEMEETGPGWAKVAWEQTSETHDPLHIFYLYSFLAVSFKSIFFNFLAEAAPYDSLYRRTAHHAPDLSGLIS